MKMKRFTAVLILAVLLFALISCGEQESPPAYLPSLQYDGVPLEVLTLLVYRTNGEHAVGGTETPAELVKQNVDRVPFTEIGDGKLEVKNGSDKNISYTTALSGIFDANGDLTDHADEELSTLPAGKYIICVQVAARDAEFTSTYLYVAGIDKK